MDVKIQILYENQWYDIDIENLREGNLIREFIDGELLKDEQGYIIRKCTCDATYNKELENWSIQSIGIRLDNNNNMEEIKDEETN